MARPRISTSSVTASQIKAERARRGLRYYIEQAWHVIEPGREYKDNWHIHCITEHLEAVAKRQIKRLIISMPPRSMKSNSVSIMWPTWTWIDKPTERFMFASYSSSLSLDHSVKRRSIIRSNWYQNNWGSSFQLSDDYDTKGEFQNDKRGTMIATSVDGAATGKGGDVIVVDDLINPKEAASDQERQHANDFFDQTLMSRFDDPKNGAIVIVAQRLHEQDVIGHVLESGGKWEQIMLPMEYDSSRHFVTSLGWVDKRKEDGELLHPDRFGNEEVEGYKRTLGSYAYCTPAESPVLMEDLSFKSIGTVRVGDTVVGFTSSTDTKKQEHSYGRRRTVPAKVLSISVSRQKVVKILLSSGKTIRCTANHKWFTGRSPKDKSHPVYAPAKKGSILLRVCDENPVKLTKTEDIWQAGWLSGFFDAEGSVSEMKKPGYNSSVLIQFSQGADRNLPLCELLEDSLHHFNFSFSYTEVERKTEKGTYIVRQYYLINNGHRLPMIQRFLQIAKPHKWVDRLTAGALGSNFIVGEEKVMSIIPDGEELVYGLETTTGNYVVWGLASSNSSQYQQLPAPAGGGMFKDCWWRYWQPKGSNLPPIPVRQLDGKVIMVQALELPSVFDEKVQSWDFAFKDTDSSDYVAGTTWGRLGADKFLLEIVNERLDLPASIKAIEDMTDRHPDAAAKYVEDKANGPAVIQSIRHRISGVIATQPEGGKVARASAISPQVESGNVYLPHPAINPLTNLFKKQHADFPNGAHDDLCFVAGTLIATTKGQVPIEDIRAGDGILTPFGVRKCLSAGMTSLAPVTSAYGLTGTAGHPIATADHGFVRLDSLTHALIPDKLSACGLIRWNILRLLNSMESPSALWEGKECITSASQLLMKEGGVLRACMSLFGKRLMGGPSLRDITYITRTLIHLITILIIWNASRLRNTLRKAKISTRLSKMSTWRVFAFWRLSGIDRRKELSGMLSMVRSLLSMLRSVLFGNLSVSGVGSCLSPSALQMRFATVLPNVDISLGPTGETTISRLNVLSADGNLLQLEDPTQPNTGRHAVSLAGQLTEVELQKPTTQHESVVPVYNLCVDRDHVYYANGILVGNCDSTSQALRKLGASEFGKLLPEFSRASHVATHPLKPWWSRWISLYWGLESCAIWFCQDDKKRVHVYRELVVQNLSAEDFAAEVMRLSAVDLETIQRMIAWTSEDYFADDAGARSIVQRFSAGINSVTGNETSFIWAFNDNERSMVAERAYAALNARRKQAENAKITLQHAKGEYPAAWEHLRHLARTTPAFRRQEVEYDRAFALELLNLPDGSAKFQQYMLAVEGGPKENLPKFFVGQDCLLVADALSSAARSEKKPTELSETPYKSILNAMAFGMLAHREDNAKIPELEFVQARLDATNPTDINSRVMVAKKAEADYKKQFQVMPINFNRGYRKRA